VGARVDLRALEGAIVDRLLEMIDSGDVGLEEGEDLLWGVGRRVWIQGPGGVAEVAGIARISTEGLLVVEVRGRERPLGHGARVDYGL